MPPHYDEGDKPNDLVTAVLKAKNRSPKLWQSKNFSAQPPQAGVEFGDESPASKISRGQLEEHPKVRSLMDELLSEICTKMNRGIPATDLSRLDQSRNKSSKKTFDSINWELKDVRWLRRKKEKLEKLIAEEGDELVKYLKKKNYLLTKREVQCNIITASIQAMSPKTREDTKMKFSLSPKGETGFSQWLDAMKMVAQLPGGMPSEFRTKLWLQLSEKHLNDQNIDWEKAEAVIFSECTNPDDEELGVQIVKDLHRTGCSLFCGEQEHNQALLKRVLLAYARWNKTVGYCQGFNMLAALILQVMEKKEKDAVKVMIYLIEGLLPESYFANNLRGLSVDMAVFRDLLRLRLPKLSRHLEALQNDTSAVNVYEPPLTNVFTMQWFLTLFSNCLPQQTVLRVWDLVFLHGNEILLRTALAIWEILQDRIITVESADEFYSIMGVVTREMLEFGLMDANALVKKIAMVDPFPNELHELREKYLYNISPWTQSVQSAARKGIKLFYSDPDDQDDTEDEEKIAVATAYGVLRRRESTSKELQLSGPTLDLNVLKQQYVRLRQRQRQAHVIITAACSSTIPRNISSGSSVSVNHLLLGKSALVSKGRRIGPPEGAIPPPPIKKKENVRHVNHSKAVKPNVTNQNKGNKVFIEKKDLRRYDEIKDENAQLKSIESITTEKSDKESRRNSFSSDSSSSSSSTELCDEESIEDKDLENFSDHEFSSNNCFGLSTSVPVQNSPESQVPVLVNGSSKADGKFEINPGCDKDNFSNVKSMAIQLVNEIEDKIQSSSRFRDNEDGIKYSCDENDFHDQTQIKQSDNTVKIVSSLNVVEKKIFPDNFLEREPEVPIKKNVIKNLNVAKVVEEVEEDKQKDIKKSDLGLSIMKENRDILHKFSHAKEKKERIENLSFSEKMNELSCEKTNKKEEFQEQLKNLFQLNEEKIPSEIEESLPPQNSFAEKAISPIVSADFEIPKAEKVNKEVNTEITFGAEEVEMSASKTRMFLNGETNFVVISSEKVEKREESKFGEQPKKCKKFLEDYRQKDEMKTKMEVSKSDWEIKMKKIAELEATARETLNEIQARSVLPKSFHRSLDRNTKRSFLDGAVRDYSPCRPMELLVANNSNLDEKREKFSSSSFDEITSRTEKLLGYSESKHFSNDSCLLEFEKKSTDCYPKFRNHDSESISNRFDFSDSSKTSITSPERWIKKSYFYHLSSRNDSDSLGEISSNTYSDSGISSTKLGITESSPFESNKNLRVSEEENSEFSNSESNSKKSEFNPFPTRHAARSKESNSKLGLHPTSPENR